MSVSKPGVGCVFEGVILMLLAASMQIFRSLLLALALLLCRWGEGVHITGNIGSLLSFNNGDKKRQLGVVNS